MRNHVLVIPVDDISNAAAEAVVHFFPTGQGNIIGNPVVPVIKLSANPLTVATMSEHVDIDLTGLLRIEMNLDQAADAALKMLERTINGRNDRGGDSRDSRIKTRLRPAPFPLAANDSPRFDRWIALPQLKSLESGRYSAPADIAPREECHFE